MKLEKRDPAVLDSSRRLNWKRGDLARIIHEFLESGEAVMEVISEPGEYKSANVLVSSLYRTTLSEKINNVKVSRRKNHVYLVRKEG